MALSRLKISLRKNMLRTIFLRKFKWQKPCERLNHQEYLKEIIGRKIYILGPLGPMVSQSSWRRTEKLCFDSGVDVLFEIIRKVEAGPLR